MKKTSPLKMESPSVIRLIFESIEGGNCEKVMSLLKSVPLDKLDTERSNHLLYIFLAHALTKKAPECVRTIYDYWVIQSYPNEGKFPLFVYMFLQPYFDANIMRFMASVFDEFGYLEVIDTLISREEPDVVMACEKASKIYGDQNLGTYQNLYEIALERNDFVVDYLDLKIRGKEDYALFPTWVQDFGIRGSQGAQDLLPTHEELLRFEGESQRFIISNLPSNTKIKAILAPDNEEEEKQIDDFLLTATREEKIQLIFPVLYHRSLSSLQESKDLFRRMGPPNPTFDGVEEFEKDGGCRMFTCDIYDYDDDDEYVDWFTGNCDQCLKKIRHRWHALRRPRLSGGWFGSYCSWECMEQSVHEKESDPNMGHMFMIDFYRRLIEEVGIQDRQDRRGD